MPSTPANPRPARPGYQRLRRLAVALLILEFVGGMAGYLTPRKEIFPLASWFLFLLVPHHTNDYDLLLRAYNGNPIDPPQSYREAAGLIFTLHSVVTYQLVQQLGDALTRHDDARVRSLRRQIESQFAQPRVRYDLVRNTYQPVERWETGRVRERQTLHSYTAGEP